MNGDVEKARNITLHELISTASRSTIESYRELAPELGRKFVPPKIWVGIWIDTAEMFANRGFDAGHE